MATESAFQALGAPKTAPDTANVSEHGSNADEPNKGNDDEPEAGEKPERKSSLITGSGAVEPQIVSATPEPNPNSLAGIQALTDLHNQSPLKQSAVVSMQGSPDDFGEEILEQVRFDENAPVAECFQSALKTWRIYKPNVINIVDMNLNDSHVEELTKFLSSKQMVVRLNLRRNRIGNDGAKMLGKFISEGDEALTHIDLTRNRIGEDGGQALLNSLYQTTRVTECKILYGNNISNKMGRIFDREIKANKQANATQEAKKRN